MHTGFVMIPQMIKSQSTALVVAEDKKLPMIMPQVGTSLTTM